MYKRARKGRRKGCILQERAAYIILLVSCKKYAVQPRYILSVPEQEHTRKIYYVYLPNQRTRCSRFTRVKSLPHHKYPI